MSSEVEPRPISFLRWIFPVFWLVFLSYPLTAAWNLNGSSRVWGLALTVVFAVVFYSAMVVSGIGLGAFARHAQAPHSLRSRAESMTVNAALGIMVLIAAVAVPLIGEEALSFLAYVSVLVVISLRRVVPGVVAACSTVVIAEIAQRTVPGWTHEYGTTFGISIAGFAMVMALVAGDRARAARTAEEENRRLEREAERLRLSQDVHDVLGHSLTVIALKAQLAAKLQATGEPEAVKHITEIEQLARGALADVRTTVQGTRTISLAGELVAATRALRAAEIEVEAPTSVDEVDSELRELFAWSVREGSTNILRHSRARHCTVTLERDRLTIVNDASGRRTDLAEVGAGSGLRGLAERAKAVGASVRTEETDDGFVLVVQGQSSDARETSPTQANREQSPR
ncbi:sensor histidine kinase [Brevibacterium aurantiacum]|uniref:Signal transduction histidine kinase subgroup 3 dimerisation and phosphoacceptor domain-containing protein n=1 Tax=Brevibacterium aurantiacum TaxID=273384 RepID=A0A556C6W4_BREAU|nr:histidine kinase [Brevibacterium aurantiacum]TSI13141.1 hypothetical protein FO013_18285 [Brevibacterium aurantiacum]